MTETKEEPKGIRTTPYDRAPPRSEHKMTLTKNHTPKPNLSDIGAFCLQCDREVNPDEDHPHLLHLICPECGDETVPMVGWDALEVLFVQESEREAERKACCCDLLDEIEPEARERLCMEIRDRYRETL